MDLLDKGDYGDKFSSFFHYYKDLGEGSYGKVVKALDRYTGQICAVKIIKKRNLTEAQVKELRQEACVLSSLDHANIVKFIAVKESNTRIFIIMEYIRGGTLGSYLKKKKMTEKKSVATMTGILRAVEYLHSHGIVHRDLKPDNILIYNSHNLATVKIADFGLSTQIDKFSKVEERCGTILYMAPELAANKAYSKEVDIWSCGIILFKLLNKGAHPLYTLHESKESYFVKLQSPKWVFPKRFPPLAMNLFLNLMKINPIERYTASQALAHPWIDADNKEIPRTYLEMMRIYDAEIKLRCIFYSCMFAAVVSPEESRYSREAEKVEMIERRKTFSAKANKQKEPSPRIKHFKTYYENFYSKSPVRPHTGKQRLKIK